MAYDTNTLTLKGAELLAAATAQDRLVLVGCDATTTYLDQASAVAIENRPTTPFSNTTDVYLIGSDANHVMARATFFAGQSTGGDANTLMLYGYKESAPNDIYVLYVASSQTAFHLPQSGDVANAYEGLFDIIYTPDNGAVTTPTTSLFVTLTEFNTMKERTVTTHKDGQPTVGENQTIYGNKSFQGAVTVGGTSLMPTANNTVSLGSYPTRFKDGFFSGAIYGASINTANAVFSGTTQLFSTNIFDLGPLGSRTEITVKSSLIPDVNGEINPVFGDSGYDLGSNQKAYKTLYCCEISSPNTFINAKKTIYCDNNVSPTSAGLGTAVGSFSVPWDYGNIGGFRMYDHKIGAAYLKDGVVNFGSYIEVTNDVTGTAIDTGEITISTPGAVLNLSRSTTSGIGGSLTFDSENVNESLVHSTKRVLDINYSSVDINAATTIHVGLRTIGNLECKDGVLVLNRLGNSYTITNVLGNLSLTGGAYPSQNNSFALGDPSYLWQSVFSTSFRFNGVDTSDPDAIFIDTSNNGIRILPKQNASVTIGRDYSTYPSALIVEGSIEAKGTITGNLSGNVTGNLTGNVTGNLTGNVTGDLTGHIPYPTTYDGVPIDTVPVGSIVLLSVTASSALTTTWYCGTSRDSTNFDLYFSTVDGVQSTKLASGQTFRLLSACKFNNTTTATFLAMRVS